jgi:hypothetical protein
MKTTETLVQALSDILYHLDPMRTCCKENDCVDEYDRVAAGIIMRIESCQPVRTAVLEEFHYWFEMAPRDETMTVICQWLESASASLSNA